MQLQPSTGFDKEKMSLFIIVVLSQNFLNTFVKTAILNNFINVTVVIQTTLDQIFMAPQQICYAAFRSQKMSTLHWGGFSQKFPNCLLGMLFVASKKTSTSDKFKNQTIDIFKILGYNCTHQQGSLKWCPVAFSVILKSKLQQQSDLKVKLITL